nr:hypothetical protein [Dehalococcoidales bacterium]
MKRRSGTYTLVSLATLVATDVTMMFTAYWLAYHLRFELDFLPVQEIHGWRRYVEYVVLQMALLPPIMVVQGLYRVRRTLSKADELNGVFTAVSIDAVLVLAIMVFVSRDFIYSRGVLVFGWLFATILIAIGRYLHFGLWASLRGAGFGAERALIVGTNETARLVFERIVQSPQLGY